MIPEMYINPALVMMVCAMITAFVLVGGLLWKMAHRLAVIELTLEHLGERFDGHITDCGLVKPQRSGD